ACDLGQGRTRNLLAGPQGGARFIALKQDAIGPGEGIWQGVTCAHGSGSPQLVDHLPLVAGVPDCDGCGASLGVKPESAGITTVGAGALGSSSGWRTEGMVS